VACAGPADHCVCTCSATTLKRRIGCWWLNVLICPSPHSAGQAASRALRKVLAELPSSQPMCHWWSRPGVHRRAGGQPTRRCSPCGESPLTPRANPASATTCNGAEVLGGPGGPWPPPGGGAWDFFFKRGGGPKKTPPPPRGGPMGPMSIAGGCQVGNELLRGSGVTQHRWA